MENKKDYLIAFDHEVDYFSYVSSDSFVKPNVSLCRDTENVFYHCKDEEENVDYLTQYFTIKNTGNDVLTITAPTSISHRKLTENEWTESDVTLNPNESVCFKGLYEETTRNITFTMIGDTTCDVEGNFMSLVYGDDFKDQVDLSVEEGSRKRYSLFNNCVQLVNAKNLILPATTLFTQCYYNMFQGCTSLVNAPELPATIVYSGCYMYMFKGCINLIESPILKAQNIEQNSYSYMFDGCSKLNKVVCLYKTLNYDESYFNNWLNGVSSTGTFIKHPQMNSFIKGVSGIPEGWVVQDYNE